MTMDYTALRNEILTGARAGLCAPHLHTAEMPVIDGAAAYAKDAAIAAILSAGRMRCAPRPIGLGTILSVFGALRGAEILDALDALRESVPAIKWAWTLIERGELDVGDAATRAQIDSLTPAVFSAAEAAALKALALVPEAVSAEQVSRALRGPWEG